MVEPRQVVFLLDECFPYRIADVLKEFGYPIVSWHEEFKGVEGIKDDKLIPYLGDKGYAWITKDDAARKDHAPEIRQARISVVWVRGFERRKGAIPKNRITTKELHKMLTIKLEAIAGEVGRSRRPLYFLLYLDSSGKAVAKPVTLEEYFR